MYVEARLSLSYVPPIEGEIAIFSHIFGCGSKALLRLVGISSETFLLLVSYPLIGIIQYFSFNSFLLRCCSGLIHDSFQGKLTAGNAW